MKKSKSSGKSAEPARDKAAKPLRDLKVTKAAGNDVRGGLIMEDYGTTDYLEF